MAQKNLQTHPKNLLPEKTVFTMFTEEEIRKLAVKKIVTSMTFDAFGHPIPGGLHDKALGPLKDKGEFCETCNKMMIACPGHFGYIDIPLPVANPLFSKYIYILLRMTCLQCFNIQLPLHVKHSFRVQMKLLNCGLVTEALEVEEKVAAILSQYDSFEKIPEDIVLPTKEYEDLADNLIASGDLKTELNNKNVEALRLKAVDTLVKSYKTRRACMSCNEAMSRISFLRSKLIMSLSHLKHYKVERIPKESGAVKENNSKFITPEESRRYLRSIYEANQDLLKFLFPVLTMVESEYPTDIFYFSVVPVTPSCTRPVNFVNNMLSEHPLTKLYKNILQNAMILRIAIQIVKNDGDLNSVKAEARDLYHMALGASPVEKMNTLWEQLQTDVNNLVDSSMIRNNDFQGGLKQIIEKKKGIIRQHMMGKRVNYAARSVIAPDPNLNIEEVGIPEEFAKTLTFPVPVTTWNVEEMRKLILNGPNVHPGANMIEYENGVIVRINPKDTVQQESIMKRLLTPGETNFRGPKYVYRHLVTGDVLLVNRQPTLHKPSIMAHTARILKGEKTLRLHYANCKAYNADFDGDEMNAHFPQNEVCRSEAYNLANVGNQFLVPKDGTPLSGLIQDHVISGVALSMRGKFFNKSDYHELVYQALGFKAMHIKLLPPAMLKPQVLWSGKQVLSTIIINIIPEGKELINLTANAKISSKAWETEKPRPWKAGGTPFKNDNYMTEAEVIIRGGELLCGILDKTHYGATPYGLVHCIYELYGGNYATRLLSSFAKVFTFNLQRRGFTLGTADILVTEKANKKRTKIIERCRKSGIEAITNAVNAPIDTPVDEIVEKVNENYAQNPKFRSIIDRNYKSCLDSYTNEINKVCIPSGLEQTFPKNNLQLMVQSGAKGSTVNTMQISCLLGQIELEGKRPPIMLSGKGLPSFPEFEFAPRAGGFVDGRFMTGIKNQEFFFHCMAGREGLIDTAVKTSRSGYLQRCLVKHLEGLKVGYDMTVRDSDGSVIQFQYGEDGMDIVKAQFLNKKQIPVLKENIKAIVDKAMIDKLKQDEDNVKLMNHEEKINEWVKQHGDPLKKKRNSAFTMFSQIMSEKIEGSKLSKMDKKSGRSKKARKLLECWKSLDADSKKQYEELSKKCPDPLCSEYQPDVHFGAMNERLYSLMQNAGIQKKKLKREFENMLKLKSMQSLANPGEPVGLLAAQSIGEPSTQMTLNTFHFAGRGEMNVTLGIPRLREILMMASKNIKTPSMEIPFLKVPNMEKKAERLRKTLTKVVVSDVLEKIDVSIENQFNPERLQMYVLRFHFLPYEAYETEYCVKPKYIIKHMTSKFFKLMFTAIQKVSKIQMQAVVIKDDRESNKKKNQGSDDEDNQDEKGEGQKGGGGDESSDSELEDEEDAKQTNKFQQAHDDQEPEVEEMETDDDGESEKEQFAKKVNIEETLLEEEAEEDELSAVQNDVVNRYSLARSYTYDKKKHLWCEIGFALPINFKKFDLSSLLRDITSKSVLWEIPLIKRAITYKKDDQLMLRTDGINITEMAKYYSILDLNKLYCNDIHQISQTYGIEAASKAIVKEVQDVFKVYGITVDPRHLSLVADYMTFNGSFEPLNRRGIESSVSPLHQMSFESSLTFLKGSLIQGKEDFLKTPSSCLFLGKPCNTGTGTFSLLAKLRA